MLIDPAQQSKAKDVNLEAMVELEEKERLVEEAAAHEKKGINLLSTQILFIPLVMTNGCIMT
jgi:hypothetical protein